MIKLFLIEYKEGTRKFKDCQRKGATSEEEYLEENIIVVDQKMFAAATVRGWKVFEQPSYNKMKMEIYYYQNEKLTRI